MICTHQCYSSDSIEKNERGETCNKYGGDDTCIPALCGEPKGKGSHGRHRLRWEENIKMNVQEVGWRGMGWFDLG